MPWRDECMLDSTRDARFQTNNSSVPFIRAGCRPRPAARACCWRGAAPEYRRADAEDGMNSRVTWPNMSCRVAEYWPSGTQVIAVFDSDSLFRLLGNAVEKIKLGSAMDAALWACGIVTIPCVVISTLMSGPSQYFVLIVAALPPLNFVATYLYFACKKPEMLRSEEHEIRRIALKLIAQKGGPITIDSVSIPVITNPSLPILPKNLETDDGG